MQLYIMEYVVLPAEKACTLGNMASFQHAPGYIVSPNYGIGNYPPTTVLPVNCRWMIDAPDGQVG